MKEKCPLVLRECHTVLPVLEELEGQISAFYQIADHAGHIIAQQHDQHKNQVRRRDERTSGAKELHSTSGHRKNLVVVCLTVHQGGD